MSVTIVIVQVVTPAAEANLRDRVGVGERAGLGWFSLASITELAPCLEAVDCDNPTHVSLMRGLQDRGVGWRNCDGERTDASRDRLRAERDGAVRHLEPRCGYSKAGNRPANPGKILAADSD